jgi:hypothetical protein
MKFCPVVPQICRGQVHGSQKERRKRIRIIIRNGSKIVPCILDTYISHILRVSKRVGVTIEFYGKVEISYINVDNF